MDYQPPRQPQLTDCERLLDCLLQQTVGNAKTALAQLEDNDFHRPAERIVLDGIRRQIDARSDTNSHVDPEAVYSDLHEKGHATNDHVRRVILNIMHARTVPAMLPTHLRTVHVSRLRRAAQTYADGILAKAKDGDLEELEVMLSRFEHIRPLINRIATVTPTGHIQAA